MTARTNQWTRITAAVVIVLSVVAAPAPAETTYQMPPKVIADLIDAPPTPATSVGPDKDTMLMLARPALPSIAEVASPELRLAGLRINPRTNGRARRSYYTGLTLKSITSGLERVITGLPRDARLRHVSWSPDGKRIAFTNTVDDGLELWVAEVRAARAKRLTGAMVNAAYGSPFEWVSDSASMVVKLVPEGRGPEPAEPTVPSGPIVQQNTGEKRPARTYQDLLEDAHDKELFDHYFTSRLATVTVDGAVTRIGAPALYASAAPSPDGKYILTEAVHRPYSYLVPVSRFPERIEILDMNGRRVRLIADKPLAEDVPVTFGSTRTGPRSVNWRADKPATVSWVEAQDGGDAGREAEVRDTVYVLDAPFEGSPRTLVNLALRFGGMMWGDEHVALASEWWWSTRKTRTWKLDPSKPGSEPMLIVDRSFEDRYNDPGRPLTDRTPQGTTVLMFAGGGRSIFLSGAGASPEGDRPFLDKMNLETKDTRRLWRSEAPFYERVVDVIDPERMTVVTRRESTDEPPNYYLRDFSKGADRALTDYPHPMPQMKDVQKELIRYERDDGVKLTGTLYLPPGHAPHDDPLPMLMWAYPQEYKSADAAGQVTDSPYRFVRTHSHSPLFWLMRGYAVLDDPSLPIIGEGDEEPNDTYVEQLAAGAKAAIDEVVRRGVADRDRIAIGGHSYGAFMTANLLAHTDLFRAGIARSGAYNRTLTPFSFQAEERTFWEASEVYFAMSPFMHVPEIDEPILLIHGEADNNSGTFPMQSERFYNALKGHGATCKLVMLPHESHGYRARESVMHMAYEMDAWLEKYVKNAGPRPKPEPVEETEHPVKRGM